MFKCNIKFLIFYIIIIKFYHFISSIIFLFRISTIYFSKYKWVYCFNIIYFFIFTKSFHNYMIRYICLFIFKYKII
ncbi:ORF MSV066 hypothetical protein [Melanoplus sanguinipes entomopoxvirus]|uniref:Uncharacterized protein n=1 Tax=Melanoplus sanguinipes entomopoxvirus TaxID=83191 RepID=Q9YW25_MSEPV|nr:ORF MSV066 hypothetical protein [Melanoplus sanguinipes entomopoxvirus]AAC97624.1 ORF MSV066 hypothetical protein [Melanoplus sanguinipes entomopoxvirus 'O']